MCKILAFVVVVNSDTLKPKRLGQKVKRLAQTPKRLGQKAKRLGQTPKRLGQTPKRLGFGNRNVGSVLNAADVKGKKVTKSKG